MKSTQPVTITRIAKELNVSIGTVDRALHNRQGISPQTKAMVLEKAKELHYEVNMLAQALSRKSPLKIGILLPDSQSTVRYFYTGIEQGIAMAAQELQDNRIEIVYEHTRDFEPESQHLAFERLLEKRINGLIFNAANLSSADDMIAKAAERNIAAITIGTDAPNSRRLCYVTCGSYTVGCIAGELMCNLTKRSGRLIVFTGYHHFDDNKKKVDGFIDTVRRLHSDRYIFEVIETSVEEETAYKSATEAFNQFNDIAGIYINTANSLGVCKRINEISGIKKLPIISSDLFPELIPLIEDDTVNVTIFQNPIQQGRLAVQLMYEYLASGKTPKNIEMVRSELILKSSLEYFHDL